MLLKCNMFHIFHTFISGGSDSKESAHNVGKPGFSSWVGKIPWRRKWQSTPVFLPGTSLGHRRLAGYNGVTSCWTVLSD